jgi:hypothetical protein
MSRNAFALKAVAATAVILADVATGSVACG